MQRPKLFKALSLVLAFAMSCPLSLPVRGAASCPSVLKAESGTLAPGTFTDKSLVDNYEDVEFADLATPVAKEADFMEPEEKTLRNRFKSKYPMITSSGTVVMNAAGRKIFSDYRLTREQMVESVFFGSGKEYHVVGGVSAVNRKPLEKSSSKEFRYRQGNRRMVMHAIRPIAPEVLENLPLPSCVVPFFCDGNVELQADKNGRTETCGFVVKQDFAPIFVYLEKKPEDREKVTRNLVAALKEVVNSPIGRVVGFDLNSFVVDISGNVYFADIALAIEAFVSNAPKINARFFNRNFPLEKFAELGGMLTYAPYNSIYAKIKSLWDHVHHDMSSYELNKPDVTLPLLSKVIRAYGQVVDSGISAWVYLGLSPFDLFIRSAYRGKLQEVREVVFSNKKIIEVIESFLNNPAGEELKKFGNESFAVIARMHAEASGMIEGSYRDVLAQGESIPEHVSKLDEEQAVAFMVKTIAAAKELSSVAFLEVLHLEVGNLVVDAQGDIKIDENVVGRFLRSILTEKNPEMAEPSFAEGIAVLTAFYRLACASRLPEGMRDRLVPLTEYLSGKFFSADWGMQEKAAFIDKLAVAVEDFSRKLVGALAEFSLDDFGIDTDTGRIYFMGVRDILAQGRNQALSYPKHHYLYRGVFLTGDGPGKLSWMFDEYYKAVQEADPNDILPIWEEYKQAIGKVGPAGDSYMKTTEMREVKVDSHWEEQEVDVTPLRWYEPPQTEKKRVEVDDYETQEVSVSPYLVTGTNDRIRESITDKFCNKMSPMLGVSMRGNDIGSLEVEEGNGWIRLTEAVLVRKRQEKLLADLRKLDKWGIVDILGLEADIRAHKFFAEQFYSAFAGAKEQAEQLLIAA